MFSYLDMLHEESSLFVKEELLNKDAIFNFDFALASYDPDNYNLDQSAVAKNEALDDISNNNNRLDSINAFINKEASLKDKEEGVLSWKVKHASRDHRLKGISRSY
jgi:hypothetical protein